ncbi:hypothetical protein JCM18899A_35690 [Nocardioides sp. AN3]
MQKSEQVQKLAAEALGTFILVMLGCGAAIATNADVVATGFTFGITVVIGVYAFGRISGGHFNPAVTVGAAVGGRFAWKQVPAYVITQVAAAIVAALVLFIIVQGVPGYDTSHHMGQNGYGDYSAVHLHWWAAFLVELIITAIFVTIILGVTDERNEHPALAPLAIGFTLAAIHFVAIPLTGTSVNPARSIGPALFAGGANVVQLWLFILAPLVGGAAAGVVYPLLFGHATEPVLGSGWRFGARAATPVPGPVQGTPEVAPGAVPGYGAPDSFQQQWNQEDLDATSAAIPPQSAAAEEPTAAEQTMIADPAAQPRIIQDGWEWDYAAQQWKPLQEPHPGDPQS